MTRNNILVIDDELAIRDLISEILTDEGYEVRIAESATHGDTLVKKWQPDIVLLDIWMPDMDGISLLKNWKENNQLHFPVVMMSGHGTIETAIEATRLGANDFIEKPISLAKLLQTIEDALETHQNMQISHVNQSDKVLDLIGNSEKTQELRKNIATLANTTNNVLFWGETGTGKLNLTLLLHQKRHKNMNASFMIDCLNCSEFVNQLEKNHTELQKQHSQISVILTNIDCLTESFQLQLLSWIKKQKSSQEHIQFLTTCQTDPQSLSNSSLFNAELLNYLTEISVYTPNLCERSDDIPELLNFYVNHLPDQENTNYRKMSFAAQNYLKNHTWPGNLHELKNLVRQLQLLGGEGEIALDEVTKFIEKTETKRHQTSHNTRYDLSLREAREEFEKDYLMYHLEKVEGKVGDLAKIVGMERTHLYRKLRALNINPKSVKP